ncbi:MAG TPA: hypothetical protein VJ650_16130 [Gemmatimonadaceae bacterium]|nr:hypothetical protein [Gemmatimonadaceae bacterium]
MRLAGSVVVALTGLALAPKAALACSCFAGHDYVQLRRDADALFIAVVEAGRPSAVVFLARDVGRLRVIRTWKDAGQDLVAVGIPHAKVCGIGRWGAVVGDTLVMLAWRDRLGLYTDFGCYVWRPSVVPRIIAQLGPGIAPARRIRLAHLWFWGPWYLLAGGLATAGGFLIRWRATRRSRPRPN